MGGMSSWMASALRPPITAAEFASLCAGRVGKFSLKGLAALDDGGVPATPGPEERGASMVAAGTRTCFERGVNMGSKNSCHSSSSLLLLSLSTPSSGAPIGSLGGGDGVAALASATSVPACAAASARLLARSRRPAARREAVEPVGDDVAAAEAGAPPWSGVDDEASFGITVEFRRTQHNRNPRVGSGQD